MISYSQQRRHLQQLLQQHLLPESKEQETLDSAGPHGQLSNAKLDLTGLWDLAKQEDPVLASPSAQSGEPDRLVLTIINTYLTSYPQTDQQQLD